MEAIERAAVEVSGVHLAKLAAVVAVFPAYAPAVRAAMLAACPIPVVRHHAGAVATAWCSTGPEIPGSAVALALRSAVVAVSHLKAAQVVEVVWTGPETPAVPVRSTVAVLGSLIDRAQRELLVVSFAAYRIGSIVAKMGEAAGRGVHIDIVLDSPVAEGGKLDADAALAFAALGSRPRFWAWPAWRRAIPGGGTAAMHAKAAVADRAVALVGSANFTGHALNHNMELGLLVEGGPVPARIAGHFAALMAGGELVGL